VSLALKALLWITKNCHFFLMAIWKKKHFWYFFFFKCQLFGNFLTFKWQFSGLSVSHPGCQPVILSCDRVPSQSFLLKSVKTDRFSLWFHPVSCVWSAQSWEEMNEQVMTYCTRMPGSDWHQVRNIWSFESLCTSIERMKSTYSGLPSLPRGYLPLIYPHYSTNRHKVLSGIFSFYKFPISSWILKKEKLCMYRL